MTGTLRFFLGTHQPHWLTSAPMPLFVSDRRLRRYRRRLPIARTEWALDSGGFTELTTHGSWEFGPSPDRYAASVRRYRYEIGRLSWAAPQDWMCEPSILARTGLTVVEHQARTVGSYLQLRALAPDLPFIPILQGWTVSDYLRCIDRYTAAGVDLSNAEFVGVGSVCRRQSTGEAHAIISAIRSAGVTHLHGFGVKTTGLARYGHLLSSADSMAWSIAARRSKPIRDCRGRHRNCANCPRYAYRWHAHILSLLQTAPVQPSLFDLDNEGGSAA